MKIELTATAEAALTCEANMLVLGGPGCGKTTLSLIKANDLVATLEAGQQVLFLSFSRSAVRQVQLRCKDVVPMANRRSLAVKTYHAFCIDLLRAHGRLLTGAIPRLLFPGRERVQRAALGDGWETERQRLARDEALYAFDLLADAVANLLERSTAVRTLVSDMYPVVILDEFQDTDSAQWRVVQQLATGSRVIMLADPDQRIFDYDARSDPARLDQVRALLDPAEFNLGDANYRSPDAGILGYADAVLRNHPLPNSSEVRTINYWPSAYAATVHAGVAWMFGQLRASGIPRPTVAVLGRSNSLVLDLSNHLSTEHSYNGRSLKPIEHDVAWDADETAAAAQVIASMMEWSGVDPIADACQTFDALADYYEIKNAIRASATARTAFDRYRNTVTAVHAGKTPRFAAGKSVLDAAETGLTMSGTPQRDWLSARRLLDEVPQLREVATSARCVRLFGAGDEIGSSLARQWLNDGSYRGARDAVRRALEAQLVTGDQQAPAACTLMSLHKSKGKEFDGVVMVEGNRRGMFFGYNEEAPHESSRRLLRVGITRARHRVLIVRPHRSRPLVD
jgi:DNA helicase-2/ATP-dependent DNA helicase PcrA